MGEVTGGIVLRHAGAPLDHPLVDRWPLVFSHHPSVFVRYETAMLVDRLTCRGYRDEYTCSSHTSPQSYA